MESQFNKVTTANALLRYQVATFALNYTLSRLLCADNSHNVGSDSKEQSLGNLVEVQLFEEGDALVDRAPIDLLVACFQSELTEANSKIDKLKLQLTRATREVGHLARALVIGGDAALGGPGRAGGVRATGSLSD